MLYHYSSTQKGNDITYFSPTNIYAVFYKSTTLPSLGHRNSIIENYISYVRKITHDLLGLSSLSSWKKEVGKADTSNDGNAENVVGKEVIFWGGFVGDGVGFFRGRLVLDTARLGRVVGDGVGFFRGRLVGDGVGSRRDTGGLVGFPGTVGLATGGKVGNPGRVGLATGGKVGVPGRVGLAMGGKVGDTQGYLGGGIVGRATGGKVNRRRRKVDWSSTLVVIGSALVVGGFEKEKTSGTSVVNGTFILMLLFFNTKEFSLPKEKRDKLIQRQ
eukprot:CAMPEP_0172520280 /NCGR_PEP_ID=MMETSP1066-20121228/291910_1 /TAXON_ID=671091 /ORGANISM="Coscinodiscus wailesii, Strain CCMP2513" /LENGTH=271 /DNA_ID=CAMNT_0013303011 /DNA_START=1233 /DNA_END=2049 /DNA_ORIENTATION=+